MRKGPGDSPKDSFFSFIIVCRSAEEARGCLDSLEKMDRSYPFEVLLAVGNNPSHQRNLAARQAKGNILVFLDNDSIVSPFLLSHYAFVFRNYGNPSCVGGPSCLLKDPGHFESAVDLVFTSSFGVGPVKGRYLSYGDIRPSGEYELILCNLAVTKGAFLETGGFNTQLHPNEENLFLNKLSRNHSIYHNPLATVYRHHRKNLWELIIQMVRYGGGRIRHYKIHPGFYKNIFIVPLIFFLYVISLVPFLFLIGQMSLPLFTPLFLYFFLAFTDTVLAQVNSRKPALTLLILGPPLFFICHFFYGLGEFLELMRVPALTFKGRPRKNDCQIIPL